MRQRILGDGFSVSPIGLGCMGMSEFYGPTDDTVALRVLDEAVDCGIDFFDTADMYGPHHNEELIGQFLASRKPAVKVATKFGIVRRPGEYSRSIDNSPAYARQACEGSLRRLGVDRIDLFYVHRLDKTRPIEQTMQGLKDLVAEGKIDRIGLCEVSAETLRRAHAIHPVTAVQTEYSLWSRHVEAEILPACRELGIGFVAYSPLGRGFLTGRFQTGNAVADGDIRASLPRFTEGAIETNRQIADTVVRQAAAKNCTPAQLSLAWLLAQGSDIVPIPGTKRLEYLRDNVKALDIDLSAEERDRLQAAVAEQPVAGARYTEEGMKGVNL